MESKWKSLISLTCPAELVLTSTHVSAALSQNTPIVRSVVWDMSTGTDPYRAIGLWSSYWNTSRLYNLYGSDPLKIKQRYHWSRVWCFMLLFVILIFNSFIRFGAIISLFVCVKIIPFWIWIQIRRVQKLTLCFSVSACLRVLESRRRVPHQEEKHLN